MAPISRVTDAFIVSIDNARHTADEAHGSRSGEWGAGELRQISGKPAIVKPNLSHVIILILEDDARNPPDKRRGIAHLFNKDCWIARVAKVRRDDQLCSWRPSGLGQ